MNIPPITLKNGRIIGTGYPTYIIAEIGSNHDGKLERAKLLIEQAKEAGADAAKFQSFQAENLINRNHRIRGEWVSDPSWETLKELSLPEDWHHELQQYSKKIEIDFLSTPFDLDRLKLLIDLNIPAIKIASGDLTYHELLKMAGQSERPVFLSTGHANFGEVEESMKVLWEAGCKDIVLLHCASMYPSDFEDANIPAMLAMQHGFHVQVGYSDHTPGSTVPLGAVALGACVIEKHFTDDKTRPGPDHPFALDIEEFAQMTTQIRQLEKALKGEMKTPRPGEAKERVMARRAIYSKDFIPQGTRITREMVNIIRHAYPEGIAAKDWDKINGRTVKQDVPENELMTWEMF